LGYQALANGLLPVPAQLSLSVIAKTQALCANRWRAVRR